MKHQNISGMAIQWRDRNHSGFIKCILTCVSKILEKYDVTK